MTAVKGAVTLHCNHCPVTTTYGLTTVKATRTKAHVWGWRVSWQADPRAGVSADPKRPDLCPTCRKLS